MRVTGDDLFEVYNGHPETNSSGDREHASTDRLWDIVNTRRLAELGLPLMYGIAVDDCHDYHGLFHCGGEPGRGWVQVNAPELTAGALVEALEAGRFYASTGVELASVAVAGSSGLEVQVRAERSMTYRIEFIGTRAGFGRSSEAARASDRAPIRATRRYSSDVG